MRSGGRCRTSDGTELDDDPFWLPDHQLQTEVRPVEGGFVIELRGMTDDDAEQIYQRAVKMVARRTASN